MVLPTLAFITNLGPWEIIIILVVALLVFGRRLPEVGRSFGRSIVEFKKGLKGIEDDVNGADASQSDSRQKLADKSADGTTFSASDAKSEHAEHKSS